MQALHYVGPSVLEWREIEAPTLTSPHHAIIKPLAVAACDLDRNIVAGKSPFNGPFILGHEFTGEVISIGTEVKQLGVGDIVLASFQPSCGTCPRCGDGFSSVCSSVSKTSMYGIGTAGGDWAGALAELIQVPYADFNLRVIPPGLDVKALASASDNLADGLRAVDNPLRQRPGANVLVAGSGSIALYTILCAKYLGAEEVSFASDDPLALEIAETLGAVCLAVEDWPRKLGAFEITMDCTNNKEGLASVINSTAPYGYSTSASIYFAKTTPMPLSSMYMKGIQFHTGRVNSASQLDRVLALVSAGLDPNLIQPKVYGVESSIQALIEAPRSRKLIIDMTR